MRLIENVEFPSGYLDCYEATIITILKFMGLASDSLIMGTQVFFYFKLENNGAFIFPRSNQIQQEWENIFGLTVKTESVLNEKSLREIISSKLRLRLPVCLPTDLYFLPYTPHFGSLHQRHFLNIFGYDQNRYFVVCPYYRYSGWLEEEEIIRSFFSLDSGVGLNVMFIPNYESRKLPLDRAKSLIIRSCRNMLGLEAPDELSHVDIKYLGLQGIQTFSEYLERSIKVFPIEARRKEILDLSRQMLSIGNSRYWFYKFVEMYQEQLFSIELVKDLETQFEEIVQLWRGIGRLIGVSIYTHKPEKMEVVSISLHKAYDLERNLFTSLLNLLSNRDDVIN